MVICTGLSRYGGRNEQDIERGIVMPEYQKAIFVEQSDVVLYCTTPCDEFGNTGECREVFGVNWEEK